MRKASLVIFLGPRGVGKSTQIKKLSSELERRGQKVKVTHLKTGIVLGYFVASLLVRLFVRKRQGEPPLTVLAEEKPGFFRKIFKLWLGLDLAVVALKFLISVYIPLKLGYNVLTEDFTPSIINDYIYLAKITNTSLKKLSFTWNIIFRITHQSNTVFSIFLDAEADVLKSRLLKRGDFDAYLNFLHAQRVTLKSVSKNFLPHQHFLYIDTSKRGIPSISNAIVSFCFGKKL